MQRAEHGEIWRFDHPANVKEFRFGGPDQPVLSFAIHLRSLLSHIAGNVDLMAGLQAQSGTASQDQLLFSQGSRRLLDLQQRVTANVEDVMRRVVWYLFHGDGFDVWLKRQVGEELIQGRFSQDLIRGDYLDFNYKIEPYSARFKSPEERLQQLLTLVSQVVMPLAPVIMQEGSTIDANALLKIAGDYANLPELDRVVRRSDRPIQAQQEGPNIPLSTRREYVRHGVSSRRGGSDALEALPTPHNVGRAPGGGNGRG